MLNRFVNCSTLEELHSRFTEETRNYSNVSVDELETIAEVFKANVDVREMPDVPLTDKGFTYILEYVADVVKGQEEETMENINNNVTVNNVTVMEVETMDEKKKVNAAVESMMNKFNEAKNYVKAQVGVTNEEFIEKTDESLNVMKDAFGNTLAVIDDIVGYSVLKEAILDMIDASMAYGSSRKDIFRMARKCRELMDKEIDKLLYWGDEDSLKKAVQLKALTDDEEGKSIFEAFAAGVIWIWKRVCNKLKLKSKDDRKSILTSICKGISSFAKVVRAGVKIIWNAAKFAASFIISGIVIAIDWLYHAIKTAVEKLKDWSSMKFNKVPVDEVELEDDECFDEAYDEVVE